MIMIGIVVSAACIGAWGLSRTVGLPQLEDAANQHAHPHTNGTRRRVSKTAKPPAAAEASG